MKKTKKVYEAHLNAAYADAYSLYEAIDNFEYMCNRSRSRATTTNAIHVAHTNHTLGTLLRKYDPIAFNVGFREWEKPTPLEISKH